MDEKLLDIQDLSVWYKTYRGFAEVVDHINLYVGKGEKIGLVGESGCGKTTTMKMVKTFFIIAPYTHLHGNPYTCIVYMKKKKK